MLDVKLFSFGKSEMEGIYDGVKDVYCHDAGRVECNEVIHLLEKLINTDLDGFICSKDKEELKKNAVSKFTSPLNVEHVMKKFCILMGSNPNGNVSEDVSGLSKIYSLLLVKRDQEITGVMENVIEEYGKSSNHDSEKEQAERFRKLLNQEYIAIMDAIDAAFLNTFNKQERYDCGGVSQKTGKAFPAMHFFQAISSNKTKEQIKNSLYILFSKIEKWPLKIMYYAFLWACRNMEVHEGDLGDIMELLLRKGYWCSLLDCCSRYKKEINDKFLLTMIELVNPLKFKEELRKDEAERLKFHADKFTQLTWGDSKDIKWPKEGATSIMLLGEAGAGKTTQMENLYCKELLDSERKVYPLWITIKELTNDFAVEGETNKLKACIKHKLKGFSGLYEEMMNAGLIVLFLDGINELIVDDKGASKRELLGTIQDIGREYPQVKMCMTDRQSSVVLNNLNIFRCAGMELDDCLDYCDKKIAKEKSEEVAAVVKGYFDMRENPKNRWLLDPKDPMTPEKMEVLAKRGESKPVLGLKEDFYYEYVDHILERERTEKKEFDNIDLLKSLLHALVKDDRQAIGWKKDGEDEIIPFFLNNGITERREAIRLFNLARRIPLIVEDDREEGKYAFAHFSYYLYFKKQRMLKDNE